MPKYVRWLVVPALVVAAACGRDDKSMDEGLRNDLSLASSMQPYPGQQFVSPMELGYGAGYGYAQPMQPQGYYYPGAPQPVVQQQPRIYRAPARASTGTSAGTATTGTRVVKNTKRDAIIGAVAGGALALQDALGQRGGDLGVEPA